MGPLPHQKLLATYPQFDAVVLPSVTLPHSVEQFGRVLAEAMSWGVPVIGSDSGAIPEVVGPAGLIVPEGNAPALAAAIQRINADVNLGRTMGAWGRKRFIDLFSCSAYAQAIAKLFEIDS
jgi:glycosyltransferase involved in cell wall biosynthesis